MPHGHDEHAIDIKLVTLAGNEYSMQANLTHYDDLTQLEDDIVSFLPTVSDIEVFGCEVDLIEPDTQLPLSEGFHTTLLQQNKLQIIVRPCIEERHSIWQFQGSDRERYPKFEFPSTLAKRLLIEPFMRRQCSGMWKLLRRSSTLVLLLGKAANNCRLSNSHPRSSVLKMGPFKTVMS